MGLSHTVSGDIASFRTPSRVPIESLKFHFLPKQAAGTPTPENPIPIEGWTGVNGKRAGKNLLNIDDNLYLTGAEKINNTFVNTTTDTRDEVQLYFIGYKKVGNNFTLLGNFKIIGGITSARHIVVNFTVSSAFEEMTHFCIKHNGKIHDFRVYFPLKLPVGATFCCSLDVLSVDVTIIGGFSMGNIQLEVGSVEGEHEPYSGEQIPITFPDGQTIYGGYVDPIAGEIVCDWFKYQCTGNESLTKWYLYGSTNNIAARIPLSICGGRYEDGAFNAKCNLEESVSNIQMYYGYTTHGICISNGGYVTIQVDGITTLNDMSEWLAENKPEIVFKASTPIHIPIPAEDLKAFLDHNNFWSDANDITEVTYVVTESKDILATRKKAMDFDHAHHKKVKWNNMAGAMNSQYWVRYNSNMIDAEFENNEALITVKDISSMPFSMSIRTNGDPLVYSNHRYYVSYCLYPYFDDAYFGAEFGNNVYTGYFYFEKNKWSRFSYRSKAGGDGMGRMYIPYFKPGSYAIGDSVRIKNAYYIDLTLMFGAGNEPSTVAEFERICELNGIDLTTYQPYDTGSDRWLIIP